MKRFGTSFFLFLFMCLLGATGLAQSSANAAPTQAASRGGSVSAGDAAEPDSGDDVYRHSASVRLLARWLHLDKESAARLFEYLNFAVLAGAVLFFLLKNLPKMFRTNRETIQHQLLEARTATQAAHDQLAAIEQRLARLDDEIAAIRKQAEHDSVEDETRIKASIEVERKRILESVGKDIAAASSAAQRDLKQFAAGLAVDRAAQKLLLTADDDRALLQEFTHSLSQQTRGKGDNN